MSRPRTTPSLVATPDERTELDALARSRTAPARRVARAQMTLGSGTVTWGIRAWSRRNREDRVRHLMLQIGGTGLLWGTIVLLTLTAHTGATMVFHTWLRSLTPSLPTTVVVTLPTSVILYAVLVSIGIILGWVSLMTGRPFLATIAYLVVVVPLWRFLYVLAWLQGHQRSGGDP